MARGDGGKAVYERDEDGKSFLLLRTVVKG